MPLARRLDNHPMQGLHLTADLNGCRAVAALMTDPATLRALCIEAVQAVGLMPVGELFHRFEALPGSSEQSGVTGVVLLAESHLAVHTWPEQSGVTIDAYVCNMSQDNSAKAHALMQRLVAAFAPQQVSEQALRRGVTSAEPAVPLVPRSRQA